MASSSPRLPASAEKKRPSVFWLLAAIVVPLTGLFARIEIIDGHKLPREGAYVLAPAQSGTHAAARGAPRRTYGHSLAVSPWGEVLADAGEGVGVVFAEIDPAAVARARAVVPSLGHDRDYVPPTGP